MPADLLTNLALRTLKPEAGPQPRLRTRFEPLPAVFAPVATEPEATASSIHQKVTETYQHVTVAQLPPERPKRPAKSQKQSDEPKATTPHPTIRQIENPQRPEIERVSDVSTPIRIPEVRVLAQPATEARAFPVPRNSLQPRKQVESRQKPPIRADAAVQERPSSVQVTIGRVEVRAIIQAPQRQSRATPKPGLMSLDEYLNRRAKGDAS